MDAAVVVRTARRRAGLTQKELAARAATTQSAVAAYESGAKQPSLTSLTSMAPDAVAVAIESDPGSTGDERWDALIGGLVERAAHCTGVRTPVWTASASRFLDSWWFLTPYVSLHASAMVETPAELANRGVFVHESSLRSV